MGLGLGCMVKSSVFWVETHGFRVCVNPLYLNRFLSLFPFSVLFPSLLLFHYIQAYMYVCISDSLYSIYLYTHIHIIHLSLSLAPSLISPHTRTHAHTHAQTHTHTNAHTHMPTHTRTHTRTYSTHTDVTVRTGATRHIYMSDMTHSYLWYDVIMCVASLVHTCDITDMTYSYM